MRYVKDSKDEWEANKDVFFRMSYNRKKPLKVGLHFVRGSRHKFDFVNPTQTIQDLMRKYGWIDDDNCDEMLPFPMLIDDSYYSYSKEKPGVYISLLTQ